MTFTNEWTQSEYHASKSNNEWMALLEKRGWFCQRLRSELQDDYHQTSFYADVKKSLANYQLSVNPDSDLAGGPFDYSDEYGRHFVHSEKTRRFLADTFCSKDGEFWSSVPKRRALSAIFNHLTKNGFVTWLSTHDHRVHSTQADTVFGATIPCSFINPKTISGKYRGTYFSEYYSKGKLVQRMLMFHHVGNEQFFRARKIEFTYLRDEATKERFLRNIAKGLWDVPKIADGIICFAENTGYGFFLNDEDQIDDTTHKYQAKNLGLSKNRRCVVLSETVNNRSYSYALSYRPYMVDQIKLLLNSVPPFFQ